MNNIVCAGDYALKDGGKNSYNGFEVICFPSGGEVEADGQVYTCGKNSVAVIPPRTIRKVTGEDKPFHVVVEQTLLPARGVKVIAPPLSSDFIYAVKKASDIFPTSGAEREILLSAFGSLIAAYISAYCGNETLSPIVLQIKEDIDKHFGDSAYSLESFIRTLPLNYDYVRKLFVKETGITPREYLTRRRMDRARDIMLSGITNRYSNYTISQISEACGFAEPLYFSRVFKKYFGVSPTEYVAKNKENNL